MKTANETSATSTAPTSAGGRANKPTNRPPKPGEDAPKHDEAAFLAQQAVDAKAAITRALSELGTGLGQAANLNGVMRQYPWVTLGASAVAGFVATAALVPSKEDQALKKLAKIERALHPEPPPRRRDDEHAPPNGAADARDYKAGKGGIGRAILGEVIKAIQPALLSMLTAGMTAKVAKPSDEEMQAAAAAEDARTSPAN